MLRHDIKFDNKHNLKLIFWWNESFRMREVDSIKKIYVLKKMNEICLNESYAENRLKCSKFERCELRMLKKKNRLDEIVKKY